MAADSIQETIAPRSRKIQSHAKPLIISQSPRSESSVSCYEPSNQTTHKRLLRSASMRNKTQYRSRRPTSLPSSTVLRKRNTNELSRDGIVSRPLTNEQDSRPSGRVVEGFGTEVNTANHGKYRNFDELFSSVFEQPKVDPTTSSYIPNHCFRY